MTVTITHRQALAAKLNALPKAVKAEIKEAIGKSAQELVDIAKRLVPVRTGDLRDSIDWSFGDAPEGSMTLAKASASSEISATVWAGDDRAFYARWIEFGTVTMRAHPYFFPSYRAMRKRAKSRISRATTKAAKKVAANG